MKYSTVEKTKDGYTHLVAYPDELGIETEDGLNYWEMKDNANRGLIFADDKEKAEAIVKAFENKIIKKMKHLKTFEDRVNIHNAAFTDELGDDERFLTDEEIADDYAEWTINKKEFQWNKSMSSGWIILERPYDESCDECETEKSDNFIIYDNGKIAFDNWYTDDLAKKMCQFIYSQMDEDHPLKEKVESYLTLFENKNINMNYLKTFEKKEDKPKAKYKKGDMVNYIPKLSGHNPKKKLEIDIVHWKEKDTLSDMFKVKHDPTWVYSFKNNHLEAIEKDIKLAESKVHESSSNQSLSNDVSTELNREMKKIWNYAKFTDHRTPRGIITPGKFLDLGETKGYINKIEGDIIFVETIDGSNEMKEVSFADVAKSYKIKNFKEDFYVKPELKESGKPVINPIDAKAKTLKDEKTNKIQKKTQSVKDSKLKNKLGGPKVNESTNSDLVDKYVKDLEKVKKTVKSCKSELQTRNAYKMLKLFNKKWIKSKVAKHGLKDDVDELVDYITKKLSKFKD